MIKQNRRSINLPTDVYEKLIYLQAEVRLINKETGDTYVPGKTAITQIIKTLILDTTAEELAKKLQ